MSQCQCILRTGPRTGQQCAVKAQPGKLFCKRHLECIKAISPSLAAAAGPSPPRVKRRRPPKKSSPARRRPPAKKRARAASPQVAPGEVIVESVNKLPPDVKKAVKDYLSKLDHYERVTWKDVVNHLEQTYQGSWLDVMGNIKGIKEYITLYMGNRQLKAGALTPEQRNILRKIVLEADLSERTLNNLLYEAGSKLGAIFATHNKEAIKRILLWLTARKLKVIHNVHCVECIKENKNFRF